MSKGKNNLNLLVEACSSVDKDSTELLEIPLVKSIDAHLVSHGVNVSLVRQVEATQVLWNFSSDDHLSIVIRFYHCEGQNFLQIEVAFGLIDKSKEFSKITELMAIENARAPAPVRVGIYNYQETWLCIVQSWFRSDSVNLNSVGQVITNTVDFAKFIKPKLLAIPSFTNLPASWFSGETRH